MTSSLDQLQAALIRDIPVNVYGQEITFKVQIPDPAQFFKHMQIGNPILEALQDAMRIVSEKAQNQNGQVHFKVDGLLGDLSPLIAKAISDNETFNSLLENINRTLHEAIIEPKLGEPGGDELSIVNIPINVKLALINEMYGGSGLLNQLAIFRDGQNPVVLTRSKSQKVRKSAKPDTGDQ